MKPTSADKDPAILRNPYLDGVDALIKSRATGLRSLRIDRATTTQQNPAVQTPTLTTGLQAPTTATPAPTSTPNATRIGALNLNNRVHRL